MRNRAARASFRACLPDAAKPAPRWPGGETSDGQESIRTRCRRPRRSARRSPGGRRRSAGRGRRFAARCDPARCRGGGGADRGRSAGSQDGRGYLSKEITRPLPEAVDGIRRGADRVLRCANGIWGEPDGRRDICCSEEAESECTECCEVRCLRCVRRLMVNREDRPDQWHAVAGDTEVVAKAVGSVQVKRPRSDDACGVLVNKQGERDGRCRSCGGDCDQAQQWQ